MLAEREKAQKEKDQLEEERQRKAKEQAEKIDTLKAQWQLETNLAVREGKKRRKGEEQVKNCRGRGNGGGDDGRSVLFSHFTHVVTVIIGAVVVQ